MSDRYTRRLHREKRARHAYFMLLIFFVCCIFFGFEGILTLARALELG